MPYRNAQDTYDVLGKNVISEVTLTLSVGGAQGANDFVGVSSTPMTFAGCAAENGGSGKVTACLFVDGDLQGIVAELWLFDQLPAGFPLDNAAWTVTDATAKYCIGVIPLPAASYYASALNSVCLGVPAAPLAFKCTANSTALYGAFVTRGTPTYTTAVPFFRLYITQD